MDGEQKVRKLIDKDFLMKIDPIGKKYTTMAGPLIDYSKIDNGHKFGINANGKQVFVEYDNDFYPKKFNDDEIKIPPTVSFHEYFRLTEVERYHDNSEILEAPENEVGSQIKETISWYSKLMEHKLTKNEYKGSWSGYSPAWLFERLLAEIPELFNALQRYNNDKDYDKIIMETTDVSNFAMFIADVVSKKYEKGQV